ncbi:hypothetical protein Daus18300_012597 [Diaporthe australafricana]|uniref:Fungal N-terminal domain-containing protein n=1 Tax=Diaporthe australafricana TaxID=127596 RepID=A0ABR3W239_9PEZI
MDPVSGFSLAVNALAVVDFSRTFLEVLGQVSEAGSPATTQHIGGIVRSLQTSNAKVKSQSRNGHDEKAFTNLVDECQKISDELLAFVEDVSVSQSSTMVTRIKITTRTMWNHSMIEQKKARLEAIRAQLLFDIVVPMAAKVDAIPDTKLLNVQTQTLLDAIRTDQKKIRCTGKGY